LKKKKKTASAVIHKTCEKRKRATPYAAKKREPGFAKKGIGLGPPGGKSHGTVQRAKGENGATASKQMREQRAQKPF